MTPQTEETKGKFYFESYGVRVCVDCGNTGLYSRARQAAETAVVGKYNPIDPTDDCHTIVLKENAGQYSLEKDGEPHRHGGSPDLFLKYFDSTVRLTIAEFAVNYIFLHAGVVGWRGKAIVIPGTSFSGKTSLTYELVRNGAEYYSDEYAVLDTDGLVHSFARPLAIRSRPPAGEVIEVRQVRPEEFGGRSGVSAIPVGTVLLTEYREGSVWAPEIRSQGSGVLEMLSQTIPIRYKPEISLEILKKATAGAIILKSIRPDAALFVGSLLEFIDSKVS